MGLLADGMGEAEEDGAGHIRQAKAPMVGWSPRVVCFTDGSAGWPRHEWTCRWTAAIDSGEYLLVEVLTFGTAGPHLRLAPHAGPSDGLLHVVLVDELHRRDLADHLTLGRSDSARPLSHLQGAACQVVVHEPQSSSRWRGADRTTDRTSAPLVIDLTIEPKTLTFLVPPSRS